MFLHKGEYCFETLKNYRDFRDSVLLSIDKDKFDQNDTKLDLAIGGTAISKWLPASKKEMYVGHALIKLQGGGIIYVNVKGEKAFDVEDRKLVQPIKLPASKVDVNIPNTISVNKWITEVDEKYISRLGFSAALIGPDQVRFNEPTDLQTAMTEISDFLPVHD